MAFEDWSTNPALNGTLPGINMAEGMPPKDINGSARQMMADIKAAWNRTVDVTDVIPAQYLADIRAGTSTVDVTQWVQEAVRRANNNIADGLPAGGRVYFPAGTYCVTRIGIRDTEIIGESQWRTVVKAVPGGSAADFIFDAKLDRTGTSFNTAGGGMVKTMTIDCTGSSRSAVSTYGGGVNCCNLYIINPQIGISAGLPIWGKFNNIKVEGAKVKGFYTYSGAGDTATNTTFDNCWADRCYRGWHITQLTYSVINACVAQDSTEINWFFEGNSNGVSAMYSLVLLTPATEGTGYPFVFRNCRDFVILSPRVISPDGTGDLMQLDNTLCSIKNFSTPGAVPGGKAHLNIINAPSNYGILLENCIPISFSDYATMRRACTIVGTDPATGIVTTSGRRFELDTAQNAERTYFEIGNIDGFSGTIHRAGDGTNIWRGRRTGGMIISSNGPMAGGGATFAPGELHLWMSNANKLMLEGKRPDGTRLLAEVTLAAITNPA